jgi:small-conductance mechanosensitive channel
MSPSRTERPGEWYWLGLFGYLMICLLGGGFVAGMFALDVGPLGTGLVAVGVAALLASASLLALPVLALDGRALSADGTAGWDPKWWRYLLGAGLVPVLAFVGSDLLVGVRVATLVAGLGLIAGTWVASAGYLYVRHERVGVP